MRTVYKDFSKVKFFVSVRMGVISKISEESTRRKISIGLGVKTTIRVLSAHLGLNRVLSAHLGLNPVLSAHLGLNRVLSAHLGLTVYYQPT